MCQFDVCSKVCARQDDVERLNRMPRLDSVIAWAILHLQHQHDLYRGAHRTGESLRNSHKAMGLRPVLDVIDGAFDTTDRLAGDVVECLLRGMSRGHVLFWSNAQLRNPRPTGNIW